MTDTTTPEGAPTCKPCNCGAPLAKQDVRIAHALWCQRWPAKVTGEAAAAPSVEPTEAHRFCWSTNEENYHDDCATREDALAECLANIDAAPGETVTVWTARVKNASEFLKAGSWYAETIGNEAIENIDLWLSENDVATEDEPVVELTKEQTQALGDLIVAFICQHGQFNRYAIADVQSHTVEVPHV